MPVLATASLLCRPSRGGVTITREAAARLTHTFEWAHECPLRAGEELGGCVEVGAAVGPGMVLVKKAAGAKDRSLRCPVGVRGTVTRVEQKDEPARVEVSVQDARPVEIGDVLRLDDGSMGMVTALVDALPGGADVAWADVLGVHEVEKVESAFERMQARSIGAYSLVTQDPIGGKSAFAGQRVGLAELEALRAYDASWFAHELWTVKSDDVPGRTRLYESILQGDPRCEPDVPCLPKIIEAELAALGFDVDFTQEEVAIGLLDDATILARMPGEVLNPVTVNYRTLLPEKGGLFCVELFGAIDAPEERRTRMAHIALAVPVLHPWAFETVAAQLGRTVKEVRAIVSCEVTLDGADPDTLESTGVFALQDALPHSPLFFQHWPVLPPDLRPIVPLDGGRWATSDLNDLYRRFINRNLRMGRLMQLNAPVAILRNEAAMVQGALDALVENGLRGRPVLQEERRLKSLADMLHVRLAGEPRKRVDYSGAATAVPVPDLAPDRVRLPREMAREIFRPWTYAELYEQDVVDTLRDAKAKVAAGDPRAEAALEVVARGYPVLLFPGAPADVPSPIASVDVELWDTHAIGLAPATIARLGLAPGEAVTVHVPVDPRAVAQARGLRGRTPRVLDPEEGGWIAGCRDLERIGPHLMSSALARAVDPVRDAQALRLLGRRA